MVCIVRKGSEQGNDGQNPIGDNAECQGDVCFPIPVNRIFAENSATLEQERDLARPPVELVKRSVTCHTLGGDGDELVPPRFGILGLHASHWAMIKEIPYRLVADSAECLRAVQYALQAKSTRVELAFELTKYSTPKNAAAKRQRIRSWRAQVSMSPARAQNTIGRGNKYLNKKHAESR